MYFLVFTILPSVFTPWIKFMFESKKPIMFSHAQNKETSVIEISASVSLRKANKVTSKTAKRYQRMFFSLPLGVGQFVPSSNLLTLNASIKKLKNVTFKTVISFPVKNGQKHVRDLYELRLVSRLL